MIVSKNHSYVIVIFSLTEESFQNQAILANSV